MTRPHGRLCPSRGAVEAPMGPVVDPKDVEMRRLRSGLASGALKEKLFHVHIGRTAADFGKNLTKADACRDLLQAVLAVRYSPRRAEEPSAWTEAVACRAYVPQVLQRLEQSRWQVGGQMQAVTPGHEGPHQLGPLGRVFQQLWVVLALGHG